MNALLISSSVLVITSAGLIGLAIPAHLANYKALVRLRATQRSANSDAQKSRLELMETRNRARLLEDSVKQGTSAVEKMHQAIATTTFGLIDHFSRDEEFRESAQRARETHNDTSRKVYQAARTTNKALHLIADSLIISRKEKKLITRPHPKNRKP